ncbi:MAG: Asp-tRNA(Asn)/Glu-tRNA(Gln) amidotransferase subunit GatA [Candidatus Saccharimonadales bacterium]
MNKWPSISSIANDVNAQRQLAKDLVDQALKLINQNKAYNTVISNTAARAYQRAAEIDKLAKTHSAGRLAGVPFIAKDNLLVFGAETTAASNILKGFNAPYQATAINKLEAEGAICVAKANLDAFGHGVSTENSDFFTTLNPKDKTRVAGGSSGGSAASVALGIVPFSVGTDSGGSIRLPASFCGVVGYKPTYGLVSRSGVIAMASSTDTVGVLAESVADAAIAMEIMSGKDELDSTTIEIANNSFSKAPEPSKPVTIGIVKEYFTQTLDKKVKDLINQQITKLEDNGVKFKEVSLASLPLALAAYYILVPAEISSNLSRYDGLRYGYSDKDAVTVEDAYLGSRSKGFGAEAKRRIMIGTYVLSSGYYDAYYKRAQTVRTKLINEFNQAFKSVDFLLGPTSTSTAFKLGQFTDDPLAMYLNDIMTVAASLVGIPAIDLPIGTVDGLPVGIQIMGGQGKDYQLFGVAKLVEGLVNG